MQNQNQTKAELEAKKAELKLAEEQAKAAEAKVAAEKAELKRLEEQAKVAETAKKQAQTELRDGLCVELHGMFVTQRQTQIQFKSYVFASLTSYMNLLRSEAELKEKGSVGSSVTLNHSNGLMKIVCSRAMVTHFNENMNIAEEWLKKYLDAKATYDVSNDLVEIIEAMLAKNKAGAYNPALVDKLLNMSIEDENFKQAKEWILKAREIGQGKDYVRVYTRNDIKSAWEYIDLSFSKLPI